MNIRITDEQLTDAQAKQLLGRIADALGGAATNTALAALTTATRSIAKEKFADELERNANIISVFLVDHDELQAHLVIQRARAIAAQGRERRAKEKT